MQHRRNGIVAMGFAAIFLTVSGPAWNTALADDPHSAVLFAGVGLQDDVIAAYGGGVWAPNGSLGATGVLLRGQVLYVDYDFTTAASPSGTANGKLYRANASIGYQLAGDRFSVALFGGIDVQNRNISPSGSNNGKLDDKVGFIITGRLAYYGSTQFPASVESSYSTANNSYWARGRAGYRFGSVTVGPAMAFLGNDDYDATRVGGYTALDLGPFILDLSLGYNFKNTSGKSGSGGGDGIYGGGTVVYLF